jgi:hypothetical protein
MRPLPRTGPRSRSCLILDRWSSNGTQVTITFEAGLGAASNLPWFPSQRAHHVLLLGWQALPRAASCNGVALQPNAATNGMVLLSGEAAIPGVSADLVAVLLTCAPRPPQTAFGFVVDFW